jgi:hypothetical protein
MAPVCVQRGETHSATNPESSARFPIWQYSAVVDSFRCFGVSFRRPCLFQRGPEKCAPPETNLRCQTIPPSVAAVVWSVGRNRYRNPPPDWLRPQLVFDLNYAADSPGRDFAQAVGAQYVDGSRFFEHQAAAQQQFWRRHLPPVGPETEPNPLMITADGNPATRNQP